MEGYFEKDPYVKELSASDFSEIEPWKLKNKKCSFVLFYAPWCPHCKAVKDEWKRLGKMVEFKDICAFNCEKNKIHLSKIQEDMPGLIPSFPTFIIYSSGEPKEHYKGERKTEKFIEKLLNVCPK